MKHLKLLVINSLIFLITAYFGLAVEASVSQIAIRPEHYNITLFQQGSFDDNLFYGRSHIFIKVSQPTLNIKLHAQPQITVLTFHLSEINSLKEQKWKKFVYNKTNHILNYHFIDELLPGHYLLLVDFYTNLIDNTGEDLFKTSYTNVGNEM